MNNIGLECIKQKLIIVTDQLAHIKAVSSGVKSQTLEKAIEDLDAVRQYITHQISSMNKLNVEYWMGYINLEIVDQNRILWIESIRKRVEEAEQAGNDVVVFQIPKKGAMEAVKEIEKLLQEKYGE